MIIKNYSTWGNATGSFSLNATGSFNGFRIQVAV